MIEQVLVQCQGDQVVLGLRDEHLRGEAALEQVKGQPAAEDQGVQPQPLEGIKSAGVVYGGSGVIFGVLRR